MLLLSDVLHINNFGSSTESSEVQGHLLSVAVKFHLSDGVAHVLPHIPRVIQADSNHADGPGLVKWVHEIEHVQSYDVDTSLESSLFDWVRNVPLLRNSIIIKECELVIRELHWVLGCEEVVVSPSVNVVCATESSHHGSDESSPVHLPCQHFYN